jgi:hypothetical protein
MLHLYAIADRPVDVTDVRGIDGSGVESVRCGDLHAVVSRHTETPPTTRETALAHAGVVEAVALGGSAAPVRFGVGHHNEAALRAAVEERARGLSAAIARVRGRVEFVVRVAEPVESAATPTTAACAGQPSGRHYLEDRLEQERGRRAALEAARDRVIARTSPLVELAVETRDRVGPAGPERCFLVPLSASERFAGLAADVIGADPPLVLGGPWAAYSFAEVPRD